MSGKIGEWSMKASVMIRKVRRNAIDLDKYTACINQANNYRIYAEFWYLDVLTNQQWDCLVLNDYEAVMPLPYQKKFGVKIIYQPIYCQQLGVFHQRDLDQYTFNLFVKKLNFKIVRSYHFNEENTAQFNLKGSKSINQILNLSDGNTIEFDKKTKKNCKSFRNKKVEIDTTKSIEELLSFKKSNSTHISNYTQLQKLLHVLDKHHALAIHFAKKEDLLGYSCYIKSKNRLIYINSASSNLGKKHCVSTGLLEHMILENLNKELILDFEGSGIESISKFFSGFGSTKTYYTKYKNLWI